MARPRDPLLIDVLPAALLVAAAQAEIWADTAASTSRSVTVPFALVVTASLAWRRRRPWVPVFAFAATSIALTAAMLANGSSAGHPLTALWSFVVVLVVAFAAGLHVPGKQAYAAGTVVLAATWLVQGTAPGSSIIERLVTPLVIVAGPFAVALTLRRQRALSADLARLGAELAAEREERAKAAVLAERTRIARELHDVVAHGVTVMTIQAGAAEQLVEGRADDAVAPLRAIRATGQQALAELRRMLGVLRTDTDAQPLSPQPGLRDLANLVEGQRGAGQTVCFDIETSSVIAPLSPGVDLTAYRLVQEALTNSHRHAPGAAVTVTVTQHQGVLHLTVVDEGACGREQTAALTRTAHEGSGHGLLGMRERVTAYGGTLEAGPLPAGGFRVHAELPCTAEFPYAVGENA